MLVLTWPPENSDPRTTANWLCFCARLRQPMTDIICLTPVKNEGWILDSFLRAASLWADQILVAEQGSRDDSRAIAQRHPKVLLIDNKCSAYDEAHYRELLLTAARRVARHPFMLSLDADERLSANWRQSDEWRRVIDAPKGTVVLAQFVNVLPDLATCWRLPELKPIGYVDDGVAEYSAFGPIHHPRVPCRDSNARLELQEIKVLHLQYIDWPGMESKQRWYQCWERLHVPSKRPIQLYRQYHGENVRPTEIERMRPEWTRGYEDSGIRIDAPVRRPPYYWDGEVLELLCEYGERRFRKLDIWDVDWTEVARAHGRSSLRVRDPRTSVERYVHRWLRQTQGLAHRRGIRYLQRALRVVGW
jgi:glycosyl transferase family 2